MKQQPRRWYLTTPLLPELVTSLKAGDIVRLSGVIYTARDAAHGRLVAALAAGQPQPVDCHGQIIYYAGPCPTPPGQVIGSVGPTTSGRMDSFTPTLIAAGLTGMIGKGPRDAAVVEAMQRYGAVYFAAIGGAGALIAQQVKKATLIAYPELGPEAIYRLEVEEFPLIVAIDCHGGNLYEQAQVWKMEGEVHAN